MKYFHAGVGKSFEEALALCAENDARIIQPESVSDMETLQDALGWTGKADRAHFWLPWANMLDGEIAPNKDDSYAGEWVHFVDGTPVPSALNGYFKGRQKTIDGLGTGCTRFSNNRNKEVELIVSLKIQ